MVLRCSLLGHDYGDTEVEREREERGSEVVVTVEEYEECSRCGERNVISENTEVTSISAKTAADALPDEFELESDAASTATQTPPETTDAGTEVAFDEGDDADDEIELPTDENGEPITDDGEILEDEEPARERQRDREHGEWPDSDDVGPPVGAENEPTEWPDSDEHAAAADAGADTDADDGFEMPTDEDGEPITDDAIVIENDTGGSGESPAAADARSVTTSHSNETRAAGGADDASARAESVDPGTGFERAGSAPTPGQSGGTPRDDVPTEFYCPRCSFDAAGNRGSLRAGDICPECRKGYLGERELQ